MHLNALGYVGIRPRSWRTGRLRHQPPRHAARRQEPHHAGASAWTIASSASSSTTTPAKARPSTAGRSRTRRRSTRSRRISKARRAFARGSRALADERRVKDLIVFDDPVGNRLEVFHGAEIASDPFQPGRSISGFRTGPLGMGHAVLHAERLDDVLPFYQRRARLPAQRLHPAAVQGLFLPPQSAPPQPRLHRDRQERHPSSDGRALHLDDVGQAYDLALGKPEMIGTTLGRHVNDYMTSFYSRSPSSFMVEYGWGGRSIDPTTGRRTSAPTARACGATTATGCSPEDRAEARQLRIGVAAGGRARAGQRDRGQLPARARRLPVVGREGRGAQDRLAVVRNFDHGRGMSGSSLIR